MRLIEIRDLTKTFSGLKAVNRVSLVLEEDKVLLDRMKREEVVKKKG